MAYIEEFGITYFNGPDLGTRISQDYRMDGVPETYYLRGQEWRTARRQIGPLAPPELDEKKIEELLLSNFHRGVNDAC